MNDLDDIFDDYAERKRKAQEEADETKRRQEESQEKALDLALPVLKSIVLPVVQGIASELQQKGHKAEVKAQLEDTKFPTVGLMFKPNVQGHMQGEIEFKHYRFDEKVSIGTSQSYEYPGGSGGGTGAEPEVQANEVDEQKVRAIIVRFVASVMKL